MRSRRFGLLVAVIAILVSIWWYLSPAITGPRLPDMIDESSGLIASRQHPGIFWTHNDSGDEPRIFAIRSDGSLVREIQIENADNRDWEAITLDAQHRLWIADVGNNRSNRDDLTIYVMPEPDPMQVDRIGATRIKVFYPEQRTDDRRNFDSEAMFAADGRIYLLTKHRDDTRTVLYRLPLDGAVRPLERLGEFDVRGDPDNYGGRVTGAAISPDGQHLAVLTYHAIFIFRRPATAGAWLSDFMKAVPLRQTRFRQCEAIAWQGQDLLITNEAGQLFTVRDPR